MEPKKSALSWSSLFLITFLAAYLFIFNEWLFAITKPSYLNNLGFTQQLQILFSVSALLAGLCCLCLLPLVFLSLVPPYKKYPEMMIKLGCILPALILSILILLLIDNFTYTLFRFGIVSTDGWLRGLYGLGFFLMIVLCYFRINKALISISQKTKTWGLSPKSIISFLLGVFFLSTIVLAFPNQTKASSLKTPKTISAELHPNILLVTSDGVDATHMSIYGYERDTTPNLRELAQSALVAENAFSNAGNTTGSVISLYTGKYPAKTRVLFPPDILSSSDSYEHLPGILRAQGYKTVQITMAHYADANDLNLIDGFDEVKNSGGLHSNYFNSISRFLSPDKALFTDEIIRRMADRICHIFFVWKMTNPFLLITGSANPIVDMERMELLKQEINNYNQPLFVHIHFLCTHGPIFFPIEQKFSAGQKFDSQGLWYDDFYDDSIYEFDKHIGALVTNLRNQGLLDNTVLIIGSDHGHDSNQLKRVPLIIRFPNEQYAGRIQANVQNLDIAPTIIDYIGLDQPNWMAGKSLISGELEQRPIFGLNTSNVEKEGDTWLLINREKTTAPFYQVGNITLIHCQKWFKLNLTQQSWETGEVEGSTVECLPSNMITDEQAFQRMVAHLMENGFDVSSLDHLSLSGSLAK